jgi:hypothetical protein
VRLVKPDGTIAFTDWISGTVPMTAEESGRFLRFINPTLGMSSKPLGRQHAGQAFCHRCSAAGHAVIFGRRC